MKVLSSCAWPLIACLWLCPSGAKAAAKTPKKESAEEKIQLVPEITYRQGYLLVRKESPYYLTRYKNFADQLYLSLKMVKTFKFVHEIVLEPAVRTVRNRPGDIETVIDQGYVRTYVNNFNFTAGKKTEYEGSGYFVNPSDLLNESKDLFDALYQREGKYLTRVGWSGGPFNLGVGYLPRQKVGDNDSNTKNPEGKGGAAEEGRAWLQANADIYDTDIRIQYAFNRAQRSTVGFSAARFFGDHFEFHVDARYQQRQRSVAEQDERAIFDCSIIETISESARTKAGDELNCLSPTVGDKEASTYTVLGTRVVLAPKRTVILEGIQNQGGLTTSELEMYNRYVRIQRDTGAGIDRDPPTRLYGRQYVFLAYQDEDSVAKTMLNVGALYNQLDRSVFANAEIRYTVTPITNVSLIHTRLMGKDQTEFGDFPFAASTYLIFRGKF